MKRDQRAELRRQLAAASARPWAAGVSAICRHTIRCANLYQVEACIDVTVPCSGLDQADAELVAATVNALEELVDDADESEDQIEQLTAELEALRAELAALRP